jgi:hypothetical protein
MAKNFNNLDYNKSNLESLNNLLSQSKHNNNYI